MSDFNRKDLDRAIDSLKSDERRKYALKILSYIEAEKRFEKRLQSAYLVLEGCIHTVPIDLEAIIFTERLHQYIKDNGTRISRIMYSAKFIQDRPAAVHDMTVGFVADIAGRVLEMLEDGALKAKEKEKRVFRFTADETTAPAVFPYEWDEDAEENIVDPDATDPSPEQDVINRVRRMIAQRER